MMVRSTSLSAILLLAFSIAIWAPSPARAVSLVDLELVLAVDSSGSVDSSEFELQVNGLAAAFRDPKVIEAIANGPHGAIAVTLIEWASAGLQNMNLPWARIHDAASAHRFADALDIMPCAIETGATSISGALFFALDLFINNGFESSRRVIDLSCDGRNNEGMELVLARDYVLDEGVTINGLAILNEHPTLHFYFEQQVIGGFGAFVEIASGYEDYARAILKKLLREIRNVPVSLRDPSDNFGPRLARLTTPRLEIR
jgi:hypothetical protein